MRRFTRTAAAGALVIFILVTFSPGCSVDNPAAPGENPSQTPVSISKGGKDARQSLILNGSFERGFMNWLPVMSVDCFSLSETNPYTHLTCLNFNSPIQGTWWSGIIQTHDYKIWLQSGTTYRLSFYLRQNVPDEPDQFGVVQCVFWSQTMPIWASEPAVAPADWQGFRYNFDPGVSDSCYMEVYVTVDVTDNAAGVALDQFALVELH
ncbi:MAG: carbohydrate binding domain-containing protein [Candidatus Zixiibacteriota bacterium]|nr:MAG: carbohydrate binding domain-containing protein [candidate division Zixibacteria bacterium]